MVLTAGALGGAFGESSSDYYIIMYGIVLLYYYICIDMSVCVLLYY